MDALTGFLQNVNYVYVVEVLVILAVIALLLFVFYSLGIVKLPNQK